MIIFDLLYKIDVWILRYLNMPRAVPHWDTFWLTLTQLHKQDWFQYAILPGLILYGFYALRARIVKVAVALGVTVALSDTLCYRLVKGLVNRPRPFQNPELLPWLHKVGEAHGPSFPSNHAANIFAGAVVLSWYFPGMRKFFYAFAALVAISRPILGVHYPSDALAGAFLGILVGELITALLLNRARWFWLQNSVSPSNDDFGGWRKRFERRA
jgi:undecaprenyl-diphosphatase